MPAEVPVPPDQFKNVLLKAGFLVEEEDEFNWALTRSDIDHPLIIPKKHDQMPLDIMMNALDKAGMSSGDFWRLKAEDQPST